MSILYSSFKQSTWKKEIFLNKYNHKLNCCSSSLNSCVEFNNWSNNLENKYFPKLSQSLISLDVNESSFFSSKLVTNKMDSNVFIDTANIIKSKLPNSVKKSNVHFEGDPIIIGYCDPDSGNEEEQESNYSSSDDDDKLSEDDCEFSKLTKSNTKFNSIASNLRQNSNRINKNFFKQDLNLENGLNQSQVKPCFENVSNSNDMITVSNILSSSLSSSLDRVGFKKFESNDKKTNSDLVSTMIDKSDIKLDEKQDLSNGHLETLNCFEKLNIVSECSKSNQKDSQFCSELNGMMHEKQILESNESINDVIEKPTKPERLSQCYKPYSYIKSKVSRKVVEFDNFYNQNKSLTGSLLYNKKQRSMSQDSPKSLEKLAERELRLAELAQELELARNSPKKTAPLPPIQSCEKSSKSYTLSRIKLPPPPRPPCISSLSKFSFKKLLKLKKFSYEQEETNNKYASNAKAWKKNGMEFDRSNIEIIHPAHLNEPDSLESLNVANSSQAINLASFQENINKNFSKKESSKPIAPVRKNKLLPLPSNLNTANRLSLPSIPSFYCSSRDSVSPLTRFPPSPPPSPPSPVPLSSIAFSHLILNDLTIENAYLSITKYNFDTINKMLLDYSVKNQMTIKSCSMKDFIYQSSHTLSPNIKLFKNSFLRSENITANLLVTPRNYIARLESFQNFLIGQYIDEENKIFAISCDYETFFTMDKLISKKNELKIELSLKQSLIILLQLVDIFQSFQTNGLDEIEETKLKEIVICLNSKSTTSTHIIYQPFEYLLSTSSCSSSATLSSTISTSLSSSNSFKSLATYSLSTWIKLILKILESKVNERETFLVISKILEEEDSLGNFLIRAKIIFEIILFQVPLNFDNQKTFSIWFDVQRSKFINVLNYQLDSKLNPKRSIYNYYYLLFITRSNFKLLFQALNKLKNKCLN